MLLLEESAGGTHELKFLEPAQNREMEPVGISSSMVAQHGQYARGSVKRISLCHPICGVRNMAR